MIQAQVRRRVLHWFSRHGLLDPDDARDMLTWEHGGFSLDASVCIAGHDRAGMERLLRYCACPPFAFERIEQVNDERVVYRLPKPRRDGHTQLTITSLELIDHLAALIPPLRLHRYRYHGVLAPHAPLRLAATACGGYAATFTARCRGTQSHRSPAHDLWAMWLARLFESLPLVCPNCGADMRIVAFITEAAPVRRILNHIGEPAEPPRISSARGPPGWDDPPVEAVPDWDALAQPQPEYVFNQDVQWVASFRRRQPPDRQRRAPPCTQAPVNHPTLSLGPLREGYLAPVYLPRRPRGACHGPRPSQRCKLCPRPRFSPARAVELLAPVVAALTAHLERISVEEIMEQIERLPTQRQQEIQARLMARLGWGSS